MNLQFIFLSIVGLFTAFSLQAQTVPGIQDSLPSISDKYLSQISSRSQAIRDKLDKHSDKAVDQLQKYEKKIQKRLAKLDSIKAQQFLENMDQQYSSLQQKLGKAGSLRKYIPSLDTLSSSLKFLQKYPQLLSNAKEANGKMSDAISKIKEMESKFQKAEDIKAFLKQRKEYLKNQLQQLGFAKELKTINKQVYYYSEQLDGYKAMLKDHKKAERKAIALLSKTKLFKDFMRRNSQLASLFRLPGDPTDPTTQASLAGLQTRAQVNSLIEQQLAAGGPNARQQFSQNLKDAQDQMQTLKNKIGQYGKGSSEDIIPEGFKPNSQKARRFLQRFEVGTNIQSQKANGYFPTTSDLGLSLGYKLNDKSILGIGASYKLGWGKDIRHINISHQGVGLRSFIDWKIKKSFWLSGGYEMNYNSEINRLRDIISSPNGGGWEGAAWRQSGLVGLSKKISLKTKFFKNTKLQLLWDFLSYQQIPKTQPVVFRVGYNF